ncbi:hypothetical protein [Cohnella sp. GCM10027633]|uniref:hypothetical protein n=1 Tax=unclassified Cohnella TaxID=2636738 RepID=UPI003637F87B
MDVLVLLGIVIMICFTVLLMAAIIRYAIDSSKTSKKIGDLIREVHALKMEVKKQNEGKQVNNEKHILDKRI